MAARAVFFIDGNNWYHAMKDAGVLDPGRLDYSRICNKLLVGRHWIATRYYIGQVVQQGETALYTQQRRFVAALRAADPRISIHFGRLEKRAVADPTARELKHYLNNLPAKIDSGIYRDLFAIASRAGRATTWVEKAVDVKLAVDMVVMAERDEFDAAYLLSADGDFTPAVEAVMSHGKSVFAACPAHGAQLAAAVTSFIRLKREWFIDCYQ